MRTQTVSMVKVTVMVRTATMLSRPACSMKVTTSQNMHISPKLMFPFQKNILRQKHAAKWPVTGAQNAASLPSPFLPTSEGLVQVSWLKIFNSQFCHIPLFFLLWCPPPKTFYFWVLTKSISQPPFSSLPSSLPSSLQSYLSGINNNNIICQVLINIFQVFDEIMVLTYFPVFMFTVHDYQHYNHICSHNNSNCKIHIFIASSP